MNDSIQYLTQTEVDNLPEEARIVVTWSGGNGPHTYLTRRRAGHPTTYAATVRPSGRDAWWNRPLDFVGVGSYHTRVYRKDPER